MAIVQTLIERPYLKRWFSVDQFADPLRCLRTESVYLCRALEILEDLAGNLHAAGRAERAASILDYLSLDLWIHAGDAEALIALLEANGTSDEAVREVCDEMRAEQRAVQELLPPVQDGLQALAYDRLPQMPQQFVISALILAEFLRLHVAFEKTAVLEAAEAALTGAELADLGRDMAFRRGMGPAR